MTRRMVARGRATRTPTSSATAPAGWSTGGRGTRPQSRVRRRGGLRGLRRARRRGRDQLPARAARPARRRCSALALETRLPVLDRHRRARARASSTSWRWAASGPSGSACPPSGSSTPGTPTGSSSGPGREPAPPHGGRGLRHGAVRADARADRGPDRERGPGRGRAAPDRAGAGSRPRRRRQHRGPRLPRARGRGLVVTASRAGTVVAPGAQRDDVALERAAAAFAERAVLAGASEEEALERVRDALRRLRVRLSPAG